MPKKIIKENLKINNNEINKGEEGEEKENKSETKQRGRPKKIISNQNQNQIQIQTQQKQNKNQQIYILKEKNSVNLHIPLSTSSDDDEVEDENEDNKFTMNNESNEEKKVEKSNLIVYLSDDSSYEDENVKNLKKQIQKKDKIIKKLKDEIQTKSDCYNETTYSVTKNFKINKLNVKLFDTSKDNKLITNEKTNICCWWCTLEFDNMPCFIPERYISNKYYVFGCFCTYNCALAYIIKDDEYKLSNRIALIKKLYAEIYETDEPLYPSPPKELLKKFGGLLSIEEYRDFVYKLEEKNYKIKFNNIYQIPFYFEENNKETNINKSL